MPLRDQFRPPVSKYHSWDGVHGGWPMMMVRDLYAILPKGYVASPNVHLGPMFEVDVGAFDRDSQEWQTGSSGSGEGGTAVQTAPDPTALLDADMSEFDEYEVRIFDDQHLRRLVATIEIVSPSNKDRPESRRAFLSKVEALLQKGICVSIVDIASIPKFNLYAELLDVLDCEDAKVAEPPQEHYAVSIRAQKHPVRKSRLEVWYYPMVVGETLPTLPIWLDRDLRVLFPLEPNYEETCRFLHIT